ncbi:hypothetical protein XELAEV_18044636mg, partial [Xenopus laevis]
PCPALLFGHLQLSVRLILYMPMEMLMLWYVNSYFILWWIFEQKNNDLGTIFIASNMYHNMCSLQAFEE